jgi:uncharacterized protein
MKKILVKYLTKSTFKIEPKIVKLFCKESLTSLVGLRILHISDLHIDRKTPNLEIKYLIDTINKTPCDFVIISGDVIDCKIEKIEDKLVFFKNINKKTYFVSGNHDLVYGYRKLHDIFKKYNLISLDNSFETLKYKDNEFILWGLSDKFSKFFKIKRDEKKLVNKIKDINLPKIFIAHQPKDYKYGVDTKSNLFLCGHTHGGQIYPFHYLVRVIQPFLRGVYHLKDMIIYVNSGIGSWGLKYRFLSKAEITILEVTKG